MKKTVLKIVSVLAAFFLGVLGMGYYLMAGNTDSTAHMASASLPLIYLEQNGRSLNLMHGYTKSMDASYIRDAVLPLPESREISVRIESPDTAVRGVHYEVRSTDTERLIEDGELTELSSMLGYDIYWLSRMVKRLTGRTYKELLQIKRLNQAAFLLLNTRLAVADVALAVGYDNTSYFYRIFKERYQMSPKEYRKNNRAL